MIHRKKNNLNKISYRKKHGRKKKRKRGTHKVINVKIWIEGGRVDIINGSRCWGVAGRGGAIVGRVETGEQIPRALRLVV